MRRLIGLVALIIIGSLFLATPALGYLFRAQVAVSDNASVTYAMLPVMWDSNNAWMADNGFMKSTALDTRVQTFGGLNKPHMVTENKTLTAIPVPALSQTNLYFATGESDLSAMDIIVGDGDNSSTGYISVIDENVTLELGDNFTIEHQGWVDTSSFETLTFKDLSVNNWVDFGAGVGVNVATERLEYNVVGGDHRSSFDWGTANISDTGWILDFIFYPDTATPANAIFGFGLFDALGNMDAFPTDAVLMRIADGVDLGVRNIIGGAITDSAQITVALDTTYYVTLERTSVTETKLSVFSDSARTTHMAGSPVTLAATNLLGGLRYIQASSYATAADASKGWFGFFGYNLVSKAGAFKTYVSGTENITSTIIGGNSATATGVSSGAHIVTTTTDNFTDNFVSDLYTDVGAGVGVDLTDGRMEWDVVNGLNIYSSMPIPTVSNISWELLFTYEVNTNGIGIMGVGLIATPADFGSAAGDALFMLMNNMKIYIRAWDGGAITTSAAINIAVDTTYYITLKRLSAISTQIWVYLDPARTVLHGSQVFAIPATIIGLDNLEVGGYNAAAAQTTGWIDDMTNPTQRFLQIYIDDSLEDAAIGASVPNNGNEWQFMVKNVMPYADNITIWIDGIKELWFEPNDMIVDIDSFTSILPDRATSVANDGTIHWGANPSGVGVSVGSMVSSGQPGVGVTAETPSRDLLPEVEASDWYVEPDVTGTLLTNPMRPFVKILSDSTELTELQAWRLLGLAFVILVVVLTIKAIPHLFIVTVAASIAIVIMVVLTIFPLWALVVALLCFFGGWVSERSPSL